METIYHDLFLKWNLLAEKEIVNEQKEIILCMPFAVMGFTKTIVKIVEKLSGI